MSYMQQGNSRSFLSFAQVFLVLGCLLQGAFSVETESINLSDSVQDRSLRARQPAPPKDYSCVHANSWLLNTRGVYSINFAATVDITTSSFVSGTPVISGWIINFNGIPFYDHYFTQSEVAALNSRPSAATDFVSGQTTAVAGIYYNFGDNIGYTPSNCATGYWPLGPGCPSAYRGTHTFPVFPSPEYKSGMCLLVAIKSLAL